jgi:NADH dehydrogenase
MPRTQQPHVVILGGGFAGLYAAQRLGRADVRVTVIDRCNHHLFQPLLYEVATAALSPADIAAPIRTVLSRYANTTVLLGKAQAIDVANRVVQLADGSIDYDYLVVATGATHSYFGHDEWSAFAPGLKSVTDAIEIRRRFLLAFEAAEREADPEARRAKLTFVVVGGGPTGVELAGTMSEIARRAIPRDFRAIDTATARVILIEAQDRLLRAFPEDLSERARQDLQRMGVEVRLGSRVTCIDGDGVIVGSADDSHASERINAENVIWAAGVQASSIGATLGAPTDRNGRVIVQGDLSIPGPTKKYPASPPLRFRWGSTWHR